MAYKDPQKAKECKHRCYLRHKEKYLAAAIMWKKNNPEKRKETVRKNNAKSYARKRAWIEKDRYDGNATTIGQKCYICGSGSSRDKHKALAIHHIDGQNGRFGRKLNNNPNNLIVLCVSCHAKIHNRWNFKNVYEYKQTCVESR